MCGWKRCEIKDMSPKYLILMNYYISSFIGS
jgi:hypothetical protein